MPIPTMDAHQRTGVLRCEGCQSAATRELPTTPSALRAAKHFVARTLPAWGITAEHLHTVQAVTRSLLQPAVAQVRATTVALTLVRHLDGIIVEICEAVTYSPHVGMFLDLPQPRGLHWWHDAQGRLRGRSLWCGVRVAVPATPTRGAQ